MELKAHGDHTMIEIIRVRTRSHALSVRDALALTPSESFIDIAIQERNEQQELLTIVARIAPARLKLICRDAVEGRLESECVRTTYSASDGGYVLRSFKVSRNLKHGQAAPFVIHLLDESAEKSPNGYETTGTLGSVTMSLDATEGRALFLTIWDYIRDWEIVNFRRRQEAQTIVLSPSGQS